MKVMKKKKLLIKYFRIYIYFLNFKDHYKFCEFILEIKNHFKKKFLLKINIIKPYFRNYSFFNLMLIKYTLGSFFSIVKIYKKKKFFTNLKIKFKLGYKKIKNFGNL
jgi:hypothetical protein